MRKTIHGLLPPRLSIRGLALLPIAILLLVGVHPISAAEPNAPSHGDRYLVGIFPAGGRRGTTVPVEFHLMEGEIKGVKLRGGEDPLGVIVDGPPGITAAKLESRGTSVVRAELTIAADAPPGRRMIRLHSRRMGLSNFQYFLVGALPEVVEKEANDRPESAEAVTLPVVVNGRVAPVLDQDCFRFTVRRGMRLTAAVAAHDFDSRTLRPRSFIDATLEIVDGEGRVLAESGDALGLDPLIEFPVPADGDFVARVKLANYQGFPTAFYRLTLGEVPYPTAVFPVAVTPGVRFAGELTGPNVPAGTHLDLPPAALSTTAPSSMPLRYAAADACPARDLPLLVAGGPQSVEAEPNDDREHATSLPFQSGVSGRFLAAGDVDWYRVSLSEGKQVQAVIHAQRLLRSPVDTLLEAFGPDGDLLQSNDDLLPAERDRLYDFQTFDSQITFVARKAGDYYLRVSEQTGAAGPRAVYHLEVAEPAMEISAMAWPDGVPVWGPGGTAAFLVTLDRRGAKCDVELNVEGLPTGWTAPKVLAAADVNRARVLMTVTAPATAKVGDIAEFQIMATSRDAAGTRTVPVQALTDYMSDDDRELCRWSPKMRAVVARDVGLRLAAKSPELRVPAGGRGELEVRVEGASGNEFAASVNLATDGIQLALSPPQKLPLAGGVIRVAIPCESLAPGIYPIVVAQAWGSETRIGMPGPCTSIVHLHVEPAKK
jgi:hypothetical protein